MFKFGKDSLIPDPTPERVYAIIEYLRKHSPVKEKAIGRINLQEIMCMSDIYTVSDNKDIFNHACNTAVEIGLVVIEDGQCFCSQEATSISSMAQFRKYTAKTVFNRKDSIFFQMTSCYILHAEEMQELSKWENIQEVLKKARPEIADYITPNAMLGWRFWASFLGEGYIHNYMLIPNPAKRFLDVLQNQKDMNVGSMIPLREFIEWLEHQCPEIVGSRKDSIIGLAVSNGLRTINELGAIELVRMPDAEQWSLYHFPTDNEYSHIIIGGKKLS